MNKKVLAVVLVMVLAVGMYFMGASQMEFGKSHADTVTGTPLQNIVSVQGEGSVTAKPDIAYINLGVQTKNEDSKLAQEENKKIMTSVAKALKDAGIKDDDIATVGYNIYQNYESTMTEGQRDKVVYVVRNKIKVTVNDIEKVGSIIDVASAAGANSMDSVEFSIKDTEELYNRALKVAMQNAKTKASTIMATFGKTADVPSRVIEGANYVTPLRDYNYKMEAMADQATPIQAGDLTIKALLTVEYTY